MKRSAHLVATCIGAVVLNAACSDDSTFGNVHPSASVTDAAANTDAAPATDTPPTDAPAPKMLKFVPQGFVDPAANGVTAITLLVPEGWQATGGVQWLPTWERLAFLQTHVADPSSGVTIDWLPIQNFMYFQPPAGFSVPIGGNYQGKAYVAPITDPVELVRQMWMTGDLAHLAAAPLQSVVEVPAIAEAFLKGFGGPGEAHGYRMRYTYTRDGQPWEQDVSFAILVSTQGPVTSWYVNFAHTEAGPAGSLDAMVGEISTVIASRITTPEWEGTYRMVTKLFIQGIQQQMADTVRFGQLLAQYRAESQRLQQQVVDERWASQEYQSQVVGQILTGTQTYTNPSDQTLVELPSTWSQYWVNDQGQYLVIDDPNFDPNTLNDGTWSQLDPAP